MDDPDRSHLDAESRRLAEDEAREQNWKRWGPYLSDRQWGTVREDYSPDGNCWTYFTHEHARSRAYRWGEDGLLGLCDRECRLCLALTLWNGRDPILKERLFGLGGPEGNHGEDVKELYYHLDATPTHSYGKALYKYPQAEFPYERLAAENRSRGREAREFEIADTGIFDEGRYFDVLVEHAKAAPEDVLTRITIINRGPDEATVHVLPTAWFRNSWSWGSTHEDVHEKPELLRTGPREITARHPTLGAYRIEFDLEPDGRDPLLLFTENQTNFARLDGRASEPGTHAKDAFNDRVVGGREDAVNPDGVGTKAAAWYRLRLAPGAREVIRVRLRPLGSGVTPAFGPEFDGVMMARIAEADQFFQARGDESEDPQEARVARQAYAGLLWSKQYYGYVVEDWLKGDPLQPPPPEQRLAGRNADWPHLFNRDVISMPDKWEYPWYAAWDLAFHTAAFAPIDPRFAKDQLILFLREWYMHPSGQIPAYEFSLSDVNPPVHAWACWRLYQATGAEGKRDRLFLARTFQKLLLNFTWWVNRKDPQGRHLFSGGFLGLDNIGVFDRSRPLPTGGHLEQADATAWMAFYCGTMLSMAIELAREDPSYEDLASKFFEHFVAIVDAMNTLGGTGLWDEQDGFYYDQLNLDGRTTPLRVRSLVGAIPLIACEILDERVIDRLPGFKKRTNWFLEHRRDLARHIAYMQADGHWAHSHRLLAIPSRDRLVRVLGYLLDESEFLSPHGIRSVSRVHRDRPYVMRVNGEEFRVDYTPGESTTSLFGGNSNWRGPIWFPINFLIVEALERYHAFYGESLQVECPTGSGRTLDLAEVACELRRRLISLFLPDASGRRPCHGDDARYAKDPHFRDLVLFYEHFDGDTGRGLGASHQTGWTALVATLLREQCRARESAQAQRR